MQEHVSLSFSTLLQSGLQWPLTLCFLGAFIDALRDWERWTEHGGYFISTPGFNAVARWSSSSSSESSA